MIPRGIPIRTGQRGRPDAGNPCAWYDPGIGETNDVRVIRRVRVFDDFLKIDEALVEVGGRELRVLALERGDSAAAIVSRRDDGMILLVRQFRYPTLAAGPGFLVETAAGVVEEGEDPAESIRREIAEELGYETSTIEPIASFYVSPGGSTERIHLFHVEVSERGRVGAGGGLASEGEEIEIVEFTRDQLRDAVAEGEINDAKTLIAAMWLLSRHG